MKRENNLRINRVKRREEVTILVNGKPIVAYSGEMLLAALITEGYRSLRRSPVDNNPRGGFCGMGICRECLVSVDGVPGIRACMTTVKDGMEVETSG